MTRKDVTLRLQCRLSEEEAKAAGLELATKRLSIGDMRSAAKESATEWRETIAAAELEADELARSIRDGIIRDVPCVVEIDYKAGIVRTTRTDTGEIGERPIREEERQASIEEVVPDAAEPEPKRRVTHSAKRGTVVESTSVS